MHLEKTPYSIHSDWVIDEEDEVYSYCLKSDKGKCRIAEYRITMKENWSKNVVALRKHYFGGKSSDVYMNRIIVVNMKNPKKYALEKILKHIREKVEKEVENQIFNNRHQEQIEFLEEELKKLQEGK